MSWECVCGMKNPDYVLGCMSGTCEWNKELVLSLSEEDRRKYAAMTDVERIEALEKKLEEIRASSRGETVGFWGWLKRLFGGAPQKI